MSGSRLDLLPTPESTWPAYQPPENPKFTIVWPPGFDILLRVHQTEEPMLVKGWGVQGFNWKGAMIIRFSSSQLFLLKSRVQ